MSILPPNPSLVAVIVLIKTKQGVKHIYHYPPLPGSPTPPASSRHNENNGHLSSDSESVGLGYSSTSEDSESSIEDADSSNSDNSDTSENSATNIKAKRSNWKRSRGKKDDMTINESGSTSPEKNELPGWRAEKRHKELLGLPPGFPAFLCPPHEMPRHRFEVVIDQLTFLGHPCFIKEDGSWRSKRAKSQSYGRSKDDERSGSVPNGSGQSSTTKKTGQIQNMADEGGLSTQDEASETEPDNIQGIESGNETMEDTTITTDTGAADITTADNASQKDPPEPSQETEQAMSMFHIVFVMNPPPLEYQIRVDDMYRHVAKNFSRALKREQARSNYVWKECEKLKAMKARHDPDSKIVLRNSRLAKAIATLFHAISNSRIAHIVLTSRRAYWLQIPIPTSISSLPSATDPQLPGVWLTSSTAVSVHDELSSTGNKRASHFALLLLTDVPSILAGISRSSPIRVALQHYLSHSTPTKSLVQISQKASIPLNDVILMASYLVHYRQARIIPPLHKKDVYIVSPNADMRRLRSSSVQFQKEFPLQPHLTTILARLYAANRPYAAIIPNKDYKESYMSMLAWLLREGWVTQLRTFAWVSVPSRIRQLVRDKVEREGRSGVAKGKGKGHQKLSVKSNESDSTRNEYESEDADTDDHHTGDERPARKIPAHFSIQSRISTPSLRSRASTSSALTAIPIQEPSNTGFQARSSLAPLLIASPTKTSGLESKYLECIASEIGENDGQEGKEAWMKCLPFFDGQYALEQLPVREGWKRSWIEGLQAGWIRDGWLVVVRSW